MLTLLVGAGLARIVGLISIPILARIYAPEDYGVLALYVSFVAILTPIMTLRYVQAIPLPKRDVIAFNLFSVCFKLIVGFSLVLAIILALWGEKILGWFNMEALMPWRWLIVLGAAGTSLYELFSLWATRKRQYKVIAKTQFNQSLIGNIVKIALGLLAFKSSGMIVGQFLSQSAGITNFIKYGRDDFKKYLPKIQRSKEKFVVQFYQDFVWFRLPSQFLMILSVQAPVMMMAALYGKESTGQLSLSMMALSLPVSLIGGAMAKAYYAEIANIGRNNIAKIRQITYSVQKKLFAIGMPIAIAAFFLAQPLFILVFGEKWSMAVRYAAILSPCMLFAFTSAPLVQVFNIIGSQSKFLMINIVRFFLIISFFVTLQKNEISSASFVMLYSGMMSIFFIFISLYVFKLMSFKV